MNRNLLGALACPLVAVLVTTAWWSSATVTAGEESTLNSKHVTLQEPTPRLQAFMRKKLKASQQVIEGLTTENLDLITKGAASMISMSKEAIWETRAGAIYTQDTADFVRTAERIVKMSKAKDVEGAALAYAQLTLQCVHCHRHVRSEKIVSRPSGARVEQLSQLFRNSE